MDEIRKQAAKAKSVEELIELAKENEIELTEESAKAYFEQLHKTGELQDDELENVAGGGCHTSDGKLIVTHLYECKHHTCKFCGMQHKRLACLEGMQMAGGYVWQCRTCKWMSYEGAWVCDNPANRG